MGGYPEAAARDGATAAASAETTADPTSRVEIEPARSPKLAVTIRRPDGQPAANIPVRIVGHVADQAARRTDANGRLSTELRLPGPLRGQFSLCLLAQDTEHNLAAAADLDEDTATLDLKLEPAVTVATRAESEGNPVTNATAELVFWTGRSGFHIEGFCTATNIPGRFEIPALPPGRRYGLNVHAPGYGRKYVDATSAAAEPGRVELDPVELRIANLKLAGRVVDSDDKPLAEVNVQISGNDQPNANTRTDREGRFAFDQVCAGPVQLFANRSTTHGNATAEGGDTNVVLKLGEDSAMQVDAVKRKLSGRIVGPDGQPVAGAELTVFPSETDRWVKSDTNGTFKLDWAVPSWQAQSDGLLVARHRARKLAATHEVPEDVTNATVRLEPALSVVGRVEGPDRAPLTNAQTVLFIMGGNNWSQIDTISSAANAPGEYTFECLPDGPRYMLSVSAPGHGSYQEEVEIDGMTNRVRLEPIVLAVADRLVAGRVVNLDDKPVSGAQISLHGDGQPQESATTDRQGRFRFQVCDGSVMLFAYDSGTGNAYANVEADAGDTNVVIQLAPNWASGRSLPRRASLVGKPLPVLEPLGLPAAALPPGNAALLCLVDIEQRPSRRLVRLLAEKHDALRQKGLSILVVHLRSQPAAFDQWRSGNPVPFPIAQVKDSAESSQWVRKTESLPWLILTDADRRVSAEGFAFEELDAKVGALGK